MNGRTERFQPFIPPERTLPELGLVPLAIGTLLGMVFGASSLYLVLRVGITVSASIPVAVISITLFRLLWKLGGRNATILENNIVQTAGSAGESIAFGLGVTMPAIMILGFDLELTRVMLVAVLGGLLGVFMMIPLRRSLIVQQHGILKYPEGTACAEVLKAAASDESRAAASVGASVDRAEAKAGQAYEGARTIFTGFGVGLLYKSLMVAFRAWKDTPERIFGAPFKAGSISMEISPELLGVGYIIGPKISGIMCAGGALAYLVLIPAIKFFGEGLSGALAPGTIPIREMEPGQIRGAYILYIGAGAVAAGGIISLLRSLPTIWHGIRGGLRDFRGGNSAGTPTGQLRTDRDLSIRLVLIGVLSLVGIIWLSPSLHMNALGALLIVSFGFLFVTVSSRLTGEIGSTSNPISGMTVATLLLTCLIFLVIGWTGPSYYVTALSVGGIVCIAASNGGTTSQDLKSGFLVGATPRSQQVAILIGALASAIVLGPILLRLNDAATVYVPRVTLQRLAADTPRISATEAAKLPLAEPTTKPGPQPSLRTLVHLPTDGLSVTNLPPGTYLVTDAGEVVYRRTETFPESLRVDVTQLTQREHLRGVQAASDSAEYSVWHKTDDVNGPPGRYLVNTHGIPVYLVDPGINGVHHTRPDGSSVQKFDAPKATLMSYIIKGILNRQLPWGLVLIGVMIALVFELTGVSSLAFAVGVYLPLSATTPILVGGFIRWLVDRQIRKANHHQALTEAELAAEGDKSPGVLLASGYIAGGALAGIVIAIAEGVLVSFTQTMGAWSRTHNPFYAGPYADLLCLTPFALITLALYRAGRRAARPLSAKV